MSLSIFTAFFPAMEVGKLKFTWKIKNFSNLQTQKLYSEVFSLGSNKWKILAFPKGNNVNHLSIYLQVADSKTLASGWSRNAKFSFTLINQIDKLPSITKETVHEFSEKEADWGFTSFISHNELHDPSKGFLIEDTCIIEADVTIYENVSVESHGVSKGTNKEETMENLTEEDMEVFFGDLNSMIFPKNVVSWQEEAEQALAIIEEALNMVPTDLNNPGRMSQLTNAFDVLSSLDDGSVLTPEQKAELLSVKDTFISLPERAANAAKVINLFTEKELVKGILDRKLGRYFVEFEKAKAKIVQLEQIIVVLQERVDSLLAQMCERKKEIENSAVKQKDMFKVSKELKAEMDVLIKKWPEYEAKTKAAKEEQRLVGTEWMEMKQLFSSLKEPFYSSLKSKKRNQ